ncbi:HlyD family type I secretion periplasmic adaptor subunit, partial [Vibrio makurazakiensis]|uniref:HlyD family type I secretion periplasmic adaptor subunit n=1 Tax=Vibrio makurazakiensis TaxID=2910250 RepID=UPI003D1038D9
AYRSRKLIWLSSALILSILAWASWATLEEVVVGDGKVVPSLSIQTIQSLEGGLIKEILVTQGQSVSKGQSIAILDDTRFKAAFLESAQQLDTLLAQKVRLQAELATIVVNSTSVSWQERVKLERQDLNVDENSHPALFNAQANYLERLSQISSELEEAELRVEQQSQAYADTRNNIKTLESSLSIVVKERSMLADVVASGAVAKVELLKLNRDIVNLEGDIASSKVAAQKQKAAYLEAIADHRSVALDFRTKAQGQLNEVASKIAQITESQQVIADQLKRTDIVSPVDGTVKEVFVRTIGGVVRPGEPIMELVPQNSQLIVEARIPPQDIAFVRPGLSATVKFSAYDFVIYGGQKGEVTYVSADALQTDDGNAYYRAHIKLNISNNDLDSTNSSKFTVIPGMQVAVDILTGEKTVLSYWLKPILRAKETSLRER